MICPAAVLALLVFKGAPARAVEDPRLKTLHAMQAELARSVEKLKLDEYDAPYFIAYQVRDTFQHEISGRYGSVFSSTERRDRRTFVDVRVGSYHLDSSGQDSMDLDFSTLGNYVPRKDGPIDDSPGALRNTLWLITDEKYKAALAAYLKKRTKRVYEIDEKDRADSFTREEPAQSIEPAQPFAFDRRAATQLVREVSALFQEHPEIFDSDVKVQADKVVRTFASAEKSALITEETLYAIHVQGVARAEDGQLLENSRDFYSSAEAKLPSLKQVRDATLEMIDELRRLRKAPVIDPYTGPAILAPVATGVLFHEIVGHRLEGDRQDDDKEGRTFKGQVGREVIPPFLSVIDDATQRAFGPKTLNGFYRFDDEGVPASRVTLIDRGVLKGFLMSRKAIKGFGKSNGHGRSQGHRAPAARMANLIVESEKKVTGEKLKQLLIEEALRQKKPYALIIRDITGGNTNTSSYGYQAFKGQPRLVFRVDARTGEEELVRGVEMVGTPLTTINKILATGDHAGVFNGFCGAESGYVPVSTVAPASLIAELELQRTAKANERPPLLASPWAIEEKRDAPDPAP
jgi:predicted Zn-dependent protease